VAKKGRGNQIWEHPLKYMVFGTSIPYNTQFHQMVMKPCQTLLKESTQERERKRNKRQGLTTKQANNSKREGP
jgi:hypothetical protein